MTDKLDWKAGDRMQCDLSFVANKVANAPEGYIAGIASTPATDLYGHKVMARAFDKSIRRKGLNGPEGIKLLAYHEWNKPSGVIKNLETLGENLHIEAQLNLGVSYVKDMYEAAKDIGGLNFSVGFTLEQFKFVDGEASKDGEYLIIEEGDLMEVSVVTFPAQIEAQMTFIKHADTTAEFEKALVASGICRSRNEAHKFATFAKHNVHLFQSKLPLLADQTKLSAHPLLDVHKLKPAVDQIARVKAMLGSR